MGDKASLRGLTGADERFNGFVVGVYQKIPYGSEWSVRKLLREARLGAYADKFTSEFNDAGELYGISTMPVATIGEKYGMTVEDAGRLEGFIEQAKQRTQYLVMDPRTGEVLDSADGTLLAVNPNQRGEIEDRGMLAPVMRWRAPQPEKYKDNDGCGPGRLLLRDGECARKLTQDVLLALCGADEEWQPGDELTRQLPPEEIERIRTSCKAYQEANKALTKTRPRFEQLLYDAVMTFYIQPTAVPGYVMDKVARIAGYVIGDIDPDGKLRMKAREASEKAKELVVPYMQKANSWLAERAAAGAQALNDYSGGWAQSAYDAAGSAASKAISAAKYAKDAAAAVGSRLLAFSGPVLVDFIRSSPGMKQFAWAMVEMLKHAYCTGFMKLFVTGVDQDGNASIDPDSTMWNTFFAYKPEEVADALSVGLSFVPGVGPLAGPLQAKGKRLQGNSAKNQRFWQDLFSCDSLKARSEDLSKAGIAAYFEAGVKSAIAAEGDSKTMGLLQIASDSVKAGLAGSAPDEDTGKPNDDTGNPGEDISEQAQLPAYASVIIVGPDRDIEFILP